MGIFIALAVAAYAMDRANSDKIADGIRIGGVDVGGMSADQATSQLHAKLVEAARQAGHGDLRRDEVRPQPGPAPGRRRHRRHGRRRARASHQGGFPTRVWRYATGGEVDREITPHITYSSNALDDFVEKVAADDQLSGNGRDCRAPRPTRSMRSPARTGSRSMSDELTSELRGAIESPHDRDSDGAGAEGEAAGHDRSAGPEVPHLPHDRPRQLPAPPVEEPETRPSTYTIAVGQQGLETPAGTYTIDDKQVNPSWHVPDSAWAGSLAGQVIPPGPADPIKARWMGFFNGAGIHGTDEVVVARHRGLARLRADVDPRRDRAVPPGPAGHPDLHRELTAQPSLHRQASRARWRTSPQ